MGQYFIWAMCRTSCCYLCLRKLVVHVAPYHVAWRCFSQSLIFAPRLRGDARPSDCKRQRTKSVTRHSLVMRLSSVSSVPYFSLRRVRNAGRKCCTKHTSCVGCPPFQVAQQHDVLQDVFVMRLHAVDDFGALVAFCEDEVAPTRHRCRLSSWDCVLRLWIAKRWHVSQLSWICPKWTCLLCSCYPTSCRVKRCACVMCVRSSFIS